MHREDIGRARQPLQREVEVAHRMEDVWAQGGQRVRQLSQDVEASAP